MHRVSVMDRRFGNIEGSNARRSWRHRDNLRLRNLGGTQTCDGNKRRNTRGTRSPYSRLNAAAGSKLRVCHRLRQTLPGRKDGKKTNVSPCWRLVRVSESIRWRGFHSVALPPGCMRGSPGSSSSVPTVQTGDVMRACFIYAAAFLTLALPAVAQVSPQACNRSTSVPRPAPTQQMLAARSAERQACAADKAAFCGGVAPGCGRPMQCLRAHGDQLSSGCRTAIEQLHAAAHPAMP